MDTTSAPASAANRRILGLVFLTVFMDFLGFSVIFPIYPQLLKHYFAVEPEGSLLHGMLDAAQSIAGSNHPVAVAALFGGLLGAIFSILQFLCAPLWGKLSDRIGRQPVLLITLTGTALAYGLWTMAGCFAVLVASRVLAGIMAGNISVAQAAAVDATSGRDRSKAMAMIGMGIAAGMLIGPAIGGLTAHYFKPVAIGEGGAALFALNPFSACAGVALMLALINAVIAKVAFPETLAKDKRSTVPPRGSVFQLHRLASADMRRAVLVNLLFFTAFAGMESTLTFVSLDLFNYSEKQNVTMFVFIAVCMILVQGGIVRRLSPKLGERKLALAGLVSGFAGFALVAAVHTETALYLALALFALAAGLTQPSLSALVSLYSDERSQGFHAGVFRSAGALARALGPVAAALLYFKTGGHTAVYVTGAVLTLLPFTLAIKLRQPETSGEPAHG